MIDLYSPNAEFVHACHSFRADNRYHTNTDNEDYFGTGLRTAAGSALTSGHPVEFRLVIRRVSCTDKSLVLS